uniref:TH1 domain-containing protein n=1 Tax=Amphimedon queenslandica TaxID=400682 RepID=A0A1X7TJH8_AMPQE
GSLYLLEVNSIKVQHRVSLADVSHISASLLPDNFFIIHVPADQDRLFISTRKTEIVTSLRIAYFDMTKQELNISLQNRWCIYKIAVFVGFVLRFE